MNWDHWSFWFEEVDGTAWDGSWESLEVLLRFCLEFNDFSKTSMFSNNVVTAISSRRFLAVNRRSISGCNRVWTLWITDCSSLRSRPGKEREGEKYKKAFFVWNLWPRNSGTTCSSIISHWELTVLPTLYFLSLVDWTNFTSFAIFYLEILAAWVWK